MAMEANVETMIRQRNIHALVFRHKMEFYSRHTNDVKKQMIG